MTELLEYKCPCCGGVIKFDSTLGKPVCPYCDTEFDIEALKGYDEDLKDDADDGVSREAFEESTRTVENEDGLLVYTCTACGGEIVTDATTSAASCPYCDNPVIMKGQLSGDLCPDLVIPFKFDKKAAKEALAKHLTGKKLLPKVFKDENHIDEIKGVYVPFWIYDTETDASMRYRATKVRAYSTAKYNCVETLHFSVVRRGTVDFKNVPVDGSTKMADDLMESVEPFDLSEAVDFKTAYLSGYLADRYDVDREASLPRAKERIKKSAEEAFRSTVHGYASVVPEQSSVHVRCGVSKYVLLPVWILNTSWKDEKFTFAMNAQTGKFVGNLPTDWGAYFKYLLCGTGAFAAIAYTVLSLIKAIGGAL